MGLHRLRFGEAVLLPRLFTLVHSELQAYTMDPSAAVILRWNSDDQPGTVGDVAAWAGLSEAVRTAIYEDLGATGDQHYRSLAAMDADTVAETIEELLIDGPHGGRAPTKMQAAQLYCFFRAARVAAGVQRTVAEEKDAQKPEPSAPTVTLGSTSTTSTDDVPLNGTLVQTGAVVAKRMTNEEIKACYANYKASGGKKPQRKATPTVEQMAAFRTQLTTQNSCFGDFAVLVPFGDRFAKKLRVLGRTIGADGVITPLELFGPPTYQIWEDSYNLWTTLCRFNKTMCLDTLIAYKDIIDDFHRTYGPACWALIYQVDVRTRLEYSVQLKREAEDEREEWLKKGLVHDFNPEQPWEYVFDYLTSDKAKEYWRTEIKDKCLLIKADAAKVEDYIDDDAKIAMPPAPPTPAILDQAPLTHRRGKRTLAIEDKSNEWEMPAVGPAPISPVLMNKKGQLICPDFQKGLCAGTDGMSRCLKDGKSLHICAVCFDNRHGAHHPAGACQGPVQGGGTKVQRRRRK